MKKAYLLLIVFISIATVSSQELKVATATPNTKTGLKPNDRSNIDKTLDAWHQAAANGKFDEYFSHMTPDSRFIGTDPAENWNIKEFMDFAKPQFDKGKAWDFKPVQRNVYMSADNKTAWFDELLDTWMKVCRGSGVMRYENGQWKIAHYVLSMTIPNDDTTDVIKIITPREDKFLQELNMKK